MEATYGLNLFVDVFVQSGVDVIHIVDLDNDNRCRWIHVGPAVASVIEQRRGGYRQTRRALGWCHSGRTW